MNGNKYLITTVISGSLFFGPPAAEVALEQKQSQHATMPAQVFNDHPVEEHQSHHIQIIGVAMSTTVSSSPILRNML